MSTGLQDFDHSEKSTRIEQLFRQAATVVAQLQRAVTRHTHRVDFEAVRETLESLPYGTGEFALACRRLDNAVRYQNRGEVGAAKYELALVQHRLAREINHGGR